MEESQSVEMESATRVPQDANPDARPPQESGARGPPFDILLDILQRQEWVLRTGRGSQDYLPRISCNCTEMDNHLTCEERWYPCRVSRLPHRIRRMIRKAQA